MNKIYHFLKPKNLYVFYFKIQNILKIFHFSKTKVLVFVFTLIFYILEFLKKKVKQYQEKKLDDALSKIKFHTDMEKQLKSTINDNSDLNSNDVRKEILFHREMILIWTKNAQKNKKKNYKKLILDMLPLNHLC